jgi:hypothetical protein
MPDGDRLGARAPLHRRTVSVKLYPTEIHSLIRLLEDKAAAAAPETVDFAPLLFDRVAQLKEAIR